ncbi:hypothetical protein EIP86_009542 [Pleurotus ostreatoroseus]|nr:hypothetical protein EIP86_009542 [Pleurotus ostreatoroseus]
MESRLPQIVAHHHTQSGLATSGSSVGSPPPFRPASAEHMQDNDQAEEQDEFAEERTGHQRQSSSSSLRHDVRTSPRPPHALSHCASVETKASFRTTGASTRGARSLNQSQSDGTSDTPYTDDPPDGYLRPPVLHTRAHRNTVSAGMPFPSQARPPQPRAMTVQSLHVNNDRDIDELATDIQQQVEQIAHQARAHIEASQGGAGGGACQGEAGDRARPHTDGFARSCVLSP